MQIFATHILQYYTELRFVVQRTIDQIHFDRPVDSIARHIDWRHAFDELSIASFSVFEKKDDAYFWTVFVIDT